MLLRDSLAYATGKGDVLLRACFAYTTGEGNFWHLCIQLVRRRAVVRRFLCSSGTSNALLSDCFLRVPLVEAIYYCGTPLWMVLHVARYCL